MTESRQGVTKLLVLLVLVALVWGVLTATAASIWPAATGPITLAGCLLGVVAGGLTWTWGAKRWLYPYP